MKRSTNEIISYFQHFIQVCFYFLGKKLGGARAPPGPSPCYGTDGVVVCAQKKLHRYWPWKTVSSHFHMLVRPMLLHLMALVSVRLFCKNLHFGQLARIFWANGLPPPLTKNCPYAYVWLPFPSSTCSYWQLKLSQIHKKVSVCIPIFPLGFD